MQQFEGVNKQARFDIEVDLLIGAKAGRSIDFEHPRFELLVEQNVEAEQLEAYALGAGNLSRSAHFVRVEEIGLGDQQRFEYDVLDVAPDLLRVLVLTPQVLEQILERALRARLARLAALAVALIVRSLVALVHRVVCQVHKEMILYNTTPNKTQQFQDISKESLKYLNTVCIMHYIGNVQCFDRSAPDRIRYRVAQGRCCR